MSVCICFSFISVNGMFILMFYSMRKVHQQLLSLFQAHIHALSWGFLFCSYSRIKMHMYKNT
ncbi:hypothetical protein BDF14DRAFT_1850559 [Spinellus fusiger]|nr:hypothetical protein BDF14DRAFT_1850559 [Spinellus fusiger]